MITEFEAFERQNCMLLVSSSLLLLLLKLMIYEYTYILNYLFTEDSATPKKGKGRGKIKKSALRGADILYICTYNSTCLNGMNLSS
jgi:hypothetical protein